MAETSGLAWAWVCNSCKKEEPYESPGGDVDDEYELGDYEDCVHCDGIVTLKTVPVREQRKSSSITRDWAIRVARESAAHENADVQASRPTGHTIGRPSKV